MLNFLYKLNIISAIFGLVFTGMTLSYAFGYLLADFLSIQESKILNMTNVYWWVFLLFFFMAVVITFKDWLEPNMWYLLSSMLWIPYSVLFLTLAGSFISFGAGNPRSDYGLGKYILFVAFLIYPFFVGITIYITMVFEFFRPNRLD